MGECVKVLVRCRPMNSREHGLGCKCIINMDSARGQCLITNPDDLGTPPKTFSFDGAYSMDSTTEAIYADMVFPLVESVMEGFNGTVFAYGQTGSGKSFSMQGPDGVPSQKGIIPRVFEHIFESTATTSEFKFLVCASYLEIYNEEVRDLLGKEIKQKLEIKEHPEKGVYVAGLSLHTIHDVKECDGLMQRGLRNRVTGATLMNADSSRSHSIFTVYVEMMELRADGEHIRTGKLHLVDLAGSERQAKTGATGERLKEATKINLSLSALGNVISALVDGKAKHIPYRDSRLTRLLQDSLGGNTKTIMVACLSPADNNYDETLSTLRYANRAKNIKNKPRINEDPKDALLREYQEEIKRLKTLLETGGPVGTVGGGTSNGASAPPVDQEAIDEEKRKLRDEYQAQVEALKQQYQAEQSSKAQLQNEIKKLKEHYEESMAKVQQQANNQTYSPSKKGLAAPSSSPTAGMPSKVDPQEALKRLQMLQEKMIGGEQADNQALKEKHKKKRNEAEKKRLKLTEALSKIESDDPMMQVYHNTQEKLDVLAKQYDKERRRVRALESEIHDLQSEFELDRIDYLDTIRRQDQQLKLLQQIVEKVQPCLRRDSNYCNLEKIKKEAVWDEDLQKWHLPEVSVVKTQLPNAGGTIMPGGRVSNGNGQPFSPRQMNGYGNLFEDDEHDRLKQKLEQSTVENIAGNYFKTSRTANMMAKTEMDKHRNCENNGSYFPSNRSTWDNLLNGVIYMDDIYERESPPDRGDFLNASSNNFNTKAYSAGPMMTSGSNPSSMMTTNGVGGGKKPQRLEALIVPPGSNSAPLPQPTKEISPNRSGAVPSAKKARNHHKKSDDMVIFGQQ